MDALCSAGIQSEIVLKVALAEGVRTDLLNKSDTSLHKPEYLAMK